MTPEQKQQATVKFAEAMGWVLAGSDGYEYDGIAPCPYFVVFPTGPDPHVLVYEGGDETRFPDMRRFNPWDNPADAIELADELGILFKKRARQDYEAYRDGLGPAVQADNLCEAICLAAVSLEDSDGKESRHAST